MGISDGTPQPISTKAPERLQMGDPGGDDLTGKQGGKVLLPAALLGGPAGEDGGDAAVRLLLDRLHHKADRFAHPGEQSDVPHRAVRDAQRPLLPGDDALTEAEIDQQIVLLGAEEGAGLEDGSGSQRLPEARRAPAEGFVLFGMNQPAFRRESSHFFYLLLFCPPVWADVRGVHLCAPPRGGRCAPPPRVALKVAA